MLDSPLDALLNWMAAT